MKIINKAIEVEISKLTPWDKNPRKVEKADLERLKGQIQKHGMYAPLLVCQREDGIYEVIGGNMRLKALRELKQKTVWVSIIEPDSEAEKIEISLSANDRAGYYDNQLLVDLISPLKDEIDLELYKIDLDVPDINLKNILEMERFDDLGNIPEVGSKGINNNFVECPKCGFKIIQKI